MNDRGHGDVARPTEMDLISAAWDAHWDTFFLFDPAAGKAVRWNRAFREVSGYSDEEIASLPAPASYYDAQDLERANAFVEQLDETGTGRIELDLICKDGRRVPTEYSVSVVPEEHGGGVRYLLSIGRDVTERQRAEHQLRLHRERLMRFMDSASESFHLVDDTLHVIEINERAMRALRSVDPQIGKERVIGRSLLEVYPFMRGPGGESKFRDVLKTGSPLQFDEAVEHPVAGTVYMTVQAFKVGDDLGIIATDISERKRAEEERLHLERQIQHAQKLESLGVLAGGIAHDFNNLLVGVLGGTDLALQKLGPTSPVRELLEDVAKSAHRAAELANQMLAYSGKGRFLVEPSDLSTLVRDMVKLLQASVAKKIEVRYDLAEQLPATEVDVTQIRQIVLNLVINAAEAIGDRVGTVSITTGHRHYEREDLAQAYLGKEERPGEYVYLQVEDTGDGIDAETVKRIFDPFFTTKSTGRGLGLAATQGIVRGHGGAILVRSTPAAGTTMTVLLPASERPADTRTETVDERDTWSGSGRALLVDDEPLVRSMAAAMLERLGFDVLEAANGRECLDVYRRHADAIQLVVLDLAMPEMGGAEVLRELRAIDPDLKVLMSSGFNEQDVTQQVAMDKSAGFIQKPYRLGDLRQRVRVLFGSR